MKSNFDLIDEFFESEYKNLQIGYNCLVIMHLTEVFKAISGFSSQENNSEIPPKNKTFIVQGFIRDSNR